MTRKVLRVISETGSSSCTKRSTSRWRPELSLAALRAGMLPAVRARANVSRGTLVVVCVVLLAAAVAARLHNAWTAPVLSGYDAFGHFTYIWFVAKTGHFPMATHGWSFFHPPLYYALMASIWNAFAGIDPFVRLKIGKVLVAALG